MLKHVFYMDIYNVFLIMHNSWVTKIRFHCAYFGAMRIDIITHQRVWLTSFVVVVDSMNNIQPPVLVAGTKTNVSVILQWTGANTLQNITYLLQRNYISGDYVSGSTEWQYHEAVQWIADDKLRVERLHPYATYRVSVAMETHWHRFFCLSGKN